ncbi:MAG: YicC family protein [Pseudomonadales bacterium]|nr:YicC family protein [Pseudomonadales bacterium]MCP5347631.1 YicC family protein [Pseudomonadales bacterium]
MIYSMTAFARRQLEEAWGSLTWEIRSVNHRYLESTIRLPETLRGLEPLVRETLRKKLNRGKVECQLRYQPSAQLAQQLNLDLELIAQLSEASETIQQIASDAASLSVAEILRWPGIIQEQETDADELQQQAMQLFNLAVDDLLTTRNREGQEMGRLIEQRLESIRGIITEVRGLLPDILQRQRDNIVTRLEELKLELDPTRLEQELVLIAQKSDVDEELDRLESHVAEVARVLKTSGQKGRRLDFLMQELNREANTLSSKSIVTETTRSAVELKVLIEQMREQIQNIE